MQRAAEHACWPLFFAAKGARANGERSSQGLSTCVSVVESMAARCLLVEPTCPAGVMRETPREENELGRGWFARRTLAGVATFVNHPTRCLRFA
jgi:hypothetical protein